MVTVLLLQILILGCHDFLEGFWMGLQSDYDLEEKRRDLHKELKHIIPFAA